VPQVRRKSKKNTKTKGGLDRWFKENWVDVKTGKPCGRQKGEKRGYPDNKRDESSGEGEV